MQDPSKPKVLYELSGKPLVGHVLSLAKAVGADKCVAIVGFGREQVKEYISANFPLTEFAVQGELLGTGHAVMQTEPLLKDFDGDILVLYGDVPLTTQETIQTLIDTHKKLNAKATVLTTVLPDAFGYGRIVRTPDGKFLDKIVEERDSDEATKKIKEMNSGICIIGAGDLFSSLKEIHPHNDQKEYYLTDVFAILGDKYGKNAVALVTTNDPAEVAGVNTKEQLAELEKEHQKGIRNNTI